MKHTQRLGVLVALALVLLLALGVAPALAGAPAQSGTGVLPALSSTPDTVGGIPVLIEPTAVGIDKAPSKVQYNFWQDAEWSAPTHYSFGTFSGIYEVLVVGHSWNICPLDSWPKGKHIAFTYDGPTGIEITFDEPQLYAGGWVQPNWWWDNTGPLYYDVTITAYDCLGRNIGSYTASMSGYYGPHFIGLLSSKHNISSIVITEDADAWGFAFTDLAYGPGPWARRGH